MNRPSPPRFCLTQVKATVLYWKSQLRITSRAPGELGVHHPEKQRAIIGREVGDWQRLDLLEGHRGVVALGGALFALGRIDLKGPRRISIDDVKPLTGQRADIGNGAARGFAALLPHLDDVEAANHSLYRARHCVSSAGNHRLEL